MAGISVEIEALIDFERQRSKSPLPRAGGARRRAAAALVAPVAVSRRAQSCSRTWPLPPAVTVTGTFFFFVPSPLVSVMT